MMPRLWSPGVEKNIQAHSWEYIYQEARVRDLDSFSYMELICAWHSCTEVCCLCNRKLSFQDMVRYEIIRHWGNRRDMQVARYHYCGRHGCNIFHMTRAHQFKCLGVKYRSARHLVFDSRGYPSKEPCPEAVLSWNQQPRNNYGQILPQLIRAPTNNYFSILVQLNQAVYA